ncbi:hypothetical protein H0H92_004123 [Tricholoma furcatifolium]|nr:hypothetical protein H0H92_004123 [Tricholoma furcatifolium]
MPGLAKYVLLLIASPFVLAVTADLKGSLKSAGISAVFPGDSSYSSASAAYNQRFAISPAAIAYPKTPQEVSQAVIIGATQNLKVVARGGGHSYIANGLGGRNGSLVLDMNNFSKITVNSSQGTAIIEAGNRLGDIATALANNGRALPHGTCAYVGIGGHAAFGGFGFTSRMWGLTLDRITAINVVLANGTVSRITNQNNAELFWGLRGSAPSFAIVTSYEVKTFPAPVSSTTFQYSWNLNYTAAAKGISAFQDFVQTEIPSQFGAEIVLAKGTTSGTLYFALSGGWYGEANQLNSVLAPFLKQMPLKPTTSVKSETYIQSVAMFAGGSLNTKSSPEARDTFYAKSLMTPTSSPLSNDAIMAFTRYLAITGFTSNTQWFIQIELYGGKNSVINAVGPDATAFAHRDKTFIIQLYASSSENKPPFPKSGFTFLDGAVNAVTSNSPPNWPYGYVTLSAVIETLTQISHSAYINYADDKLEDWSSRYYGAHYSRLQALKRKYDPKDVFDFQTGITN